MAILTDDLGSVIWSTVFSYPGMDNGMNAVQTTDMGWVIGGKLGMDACLIKLASNGNMEWSAVYPEINPSASTIWADLVATHPDGGFVISSNGAGANADDMIVVKVDSCGWACSYAPVGLVQSFPTIAVSSGPTAPSGTLLTTNVQSWSTYDLLPTIVASLLEPCDPQCWIDLEQVPLVACVGVPVAICPGTNSATSGANSWSWDLGDGTTSTAPGSVMHVYASAGVYTVSVTATDTVNGCADTLQMAVTVSEPADAGLDGLVRVCPNAPLVDLFAQLGGSPFPAGQWSGPGGSPSNGWWNPALDPTGFYSYVVQASSGCPDTSRVFVDLFPGAFAGPDTSFTLCTGSGVVDLDLLLAAWASAAGTWRDPSGSQVPNGLVDAATAPSGAYVYIDATQFCADSAVYDILFDICSGLSDLHFAGGMSAWWLDDDHLVFLCPMDLQSALLELTITDLLGRIILKRDVGWSREPTTLALGRGRNMSCTILRLFDPTSQRSATVVLLPHH
ncbi:MAG: PKD domain-containing protein [Flavobacteriales bacterium]|nr:PKD domain-containing protein [Flavobacteriales bacterium]